MNIKKSILLLLAFMGVSFSVSISATDYYKITSAPSSNSRYKNISCSELREGNIVTVSFCTSGGTYYDLLVNEQHSFNYIGVSGVSSPTLTLYGAGRFTVGKAQFLGSCDNGQMPTGPNNACEDPVPECEGSDTWDPDLKLCVPPTPFCEQPSTQNQIFSAEQSCADKGGIFSHQCFNGNDLVPPSLETSCKEAPDTCIMGFPAWPECLGDYDPTTPIDPPSGGFQSDPTLPDANGSGGNPPPDGFDKPEPDSVQPTDNTDSAVLQAIINANRDSNQALAHINQDLNNAFNQANNNLRQLNELNSAIGKSIVEQMNQDYQIAEANRIQMLNQNSVISGVGEGLENAIGTQTDELGDKLDSLSGTFSGGADNMVNVLEDINSGLGGIEDKICDPRTDEFNCEGKGGEVSSEYVTGLITDLTGSVSAADSTSSDALTDAIDGLILDSGTGEVQGVIQGNIDLMFGALPTIGSCSPFSFPSYFGPVEFGCEFSSRFKSIASFILYIYTAWTLISIILSGVTPIPASSNGTRS